MVLAHSIPEPASLRIGIVTETYPPEVNGVALTLVSLAAGLTALGHRVTVIRPRRHDLDHAQGEIDVVSVPGAPLPRYPDLRFGLPVTRRLRSLWRRERPDLVYVATEGPLGWAALRAGRELAIPVASGFHTRFDDYAAHYRLALMRGWIGRYLRRFHNNTVTTLVPTHALHTELCRNGYENVAVLNRGVDTALFHPAKRDPALRRTWRADNNTPVVLTVGRIAPEKNLELAVQAYRSFQAQEPEARYVWVGDGPMRARLARAHPGCIFTGVLRGEELARHYASADVFLFPSVTETFGNVTLEALASGLALVAFDYGAAREHVSAPTHGLLAPMSDENEFIALTEKLGREPQLRMRLARNARRAVVRLSPEQVAQNFVGLLRPYLAEAAA